MRRDESVDLRHLASLESAAAAEARQDADEETDVGHWRVLRTLGHGAFGRVVLARRFGGGAGAGGELAALKLLPRGRPMRQLATYVAREVLHQASLRHPLVVALREVLLTPRSLAIAMEWVSGGTLLDHLQARGRLPEREARWLFQQLALGLAYCHDMGVANRDLKLDNLLLERPAAAAAGGGGGGSGVADLPLLKICDFGYSKHEENSSAKTSVGTPAYMAPEVVRGEARYSAKAADIWSAGVVLYALLFGCFPFDPGARDCALLITRGQWSVPAGAAASGEAVHLLGRMLEVDPAQRIGMPGVLGHPWFLQDLPPGAADMNRQLLAAAPSLDQYVARVGALVEAAAVEGAPWDAAQVVSFEGAPGGGGGGA